MDVIPLHTTKKEIEFINGLGTFCIDEKTGLTNKNGLNRRNHKQLLRNYIIAAEKRVEWSGIDRDKVIGHAMNRLTVWNKAA